MEPMKPVMLFKGKAKDVFVAIGRVCITDRPIDMEPTSLVWYNTAWYEEKVNLMPSQLWREIEELRLAKGK